MKVVWKKKGHTVCHHATTTPHHHVADMPLWAINLAWWKGSICRHCIPEPLLPEPDFWPF